MEDSIHLIVSFFIICVARSYQDWLDEFDYHTFMVGSDGKFELYWNANEDDCTLEVGMAVETDGWVGFGISANGAGMQNSDIVLGWITSDGEYILGNRIGTGFSTPQLFADQSHIKKIDGWKDVDSNGTAMTYLRFEKEMFPDFDPLAVPIKIGTTKVIFAWRDGELAADAAPTNHGRCGDAGPGCRGVESMNLLQGEQKARPLPPDARSHDVYYDSVAVPSTHTTYYCSLHALPPLEEKHHIVQIDPLIEPQNIGIVHHILMFVCPANTINMSHVGTGSVCDVMSDNMPGVECWGGVVFLGWAVGGKEFYYPENVGMEMGGNDLDALQYVLMETHYDNPQLRDDIIDSSGMRFWYTPTLRPMSAVMLMLGIESDITSLFIPPGIERVATSGYCFTDCITAGIQGTSDDGEDEKVYAFANLLHAHLLGTQLTLRHIRNGRELRPLDMNLAYDFNYQQFTSFSEVVEIWPGDELIVECVYDSTSAEAMTWGGESTKEEMCLSFLMVYPKPKLAFCTSTFLGDYDESGQFTEDLGRFWSEAEERGYVNISSAAIYDVNQEGALQFYTDFQEGNIYTDNHGNGALRAQLCLNYNNERIVDGMTVNSVLRSDVEYSSFGDDGYYVCVMDEDEGFQWDGWYVYLVGSLLGVILVVLFVYIIFKIKTKNRTESVYHQVLNKEKHYGSNREISMQDTRM